MKKILKCRVTIFLLFGWVLLSVVGYQGKDNIYKKYTQDVRKTPYFVLVLQGIHDGIYPWSSEQVDFWERIAQHIGQDQGELPAEEIPFAAETEEKTPAAETQVPETEKVQKTKSFIQVDESYFDDAVFIGDSRTVGLHDYGGLEKATFYATVGLNVYDMWEEAFCEIDGENKTLEEALSLRQFKKVYFQIGINEMGRGNLESFMLAYSQSVEKIKQLQPDAIIYVQGIMRVTKEKSEEDKIFNNQGIQVRNERIAQLADNQTVFYIDMNEAVCDHEGNLKDDLTFDNLHLFGSKYNIWVDFLMTKGIELD